MALRVPEPGDAAQQFLGTQVDVTGSNFGSHDQNEGIADYGFEVQFCGIITTADYSEHKRIVPDLADDFLRIADTKIHDDFGIFLPKSG
jgi:hypothetical protein